MEKNIFEKNLNSLSKYNPLVLSELLKINKKNKVKNNSQDEIRLIKEGKEYLLHSKYNPYDEAEKMIRHVDRNKDSLVIVFGLGLGYHIFGLKQKITKDSRVIIVEHNVDILMYALHNIDFSDIFDSPQFFLVFGEEELKELLIVNCLSSNFYNLSLNIVPISLLNYHVYQQENTNVFKMISKSLTSTLYSYGNALDDMLTGFRNNYLNIDAIINSNSIEEIQGAFRDKPAIIVASGPSLDKNIEHLKEAYGNALIIACDASLEACLKQGIIPDGIASIERDEPTYTFYYKDKQIDERIVLFGPGLLWPKIFNEYKGKKIIMSKMNYGIEGWWHNHFDNIKYVNQGQSAATVAFAAAKEAGCNPIILIGQDLAYSDGRKHSDLTHTVYEGANTDSEFDGSYVEDYKGNLLRTCQVYLLFKTWFEYQILINKDLKVIDATEGGAYIKGSKVMTLKEAINSYCTSSIDGNVNDILKEKGITNEYRESKYSQVITSIAKEINSLESIMSISKKHYDLLLKIEQENIFEECSDTQLIDIIQKMSAGDLVINEIQSNYSVLETFYKQIIVQTIIFVKNIGNELTSKNVIRNHELQKSLMYMIYESSKIIKEEFAKGLEYIRNKKNNLS